MGAESRANGPLLIDILAVSQHSYSGKATCVAALCPAVLVAATLNLLGRFSGPDRHSAAPLDHLAQRVVMCRR